MRIEEGFIHIKYVLAGCISGGELLDCPGIPETGMAQQGTGMVLQVTGMVQRVTGMEQRVTMRLHARKGFTHCKRTCECHPC